MQAITVNSDQVVPVLIRVIASLLVVGLLSGCGGAKVLKEPQPIQINQPLVEASIQQVTGTLDWVIVRNGPGTWARNADWDEYLLRIDNQTGQPIIVNRIIVVDSLDTEIAPESGRKQLVKSSKKTARRYKGSGIKVQAGRGVGTMLIAGAAVTTVGVGTAYAAAYGAAMSGAAAGSAGVVAASGLLLLGPALAVGGVVRGVNNSKVNKQIELRQTVLPTEVLAGEEANLDIFFPLAPSPRRLELTYTDATGEHKLVLDTSAALDGLHIDKPEE